MPDPAPQLAIALVSVNGARTRNTADVKMGASKPTINSGTPQSSRWPVTSPRPEDGDVQQVKDMRAVARLGRAKLRSAESCGLSQQSRGNSFHGTPFVVKLLTTSLRGWHEKFLLQRRRHRIPATTFFFFNML